MRLSKLNAELNGVEDRFEVLDNMDTKNITRALKGKKLEFAVSNPPFNIVPAEYGKAFTHFGFGGKDGLDITRIFLDQSREHLKPGAELFMYSQFALGKNSKYALDETIRRDFANTFDARLERLGGDKLGLSMPRSVYAAALADFMVANTPEFKRADASDLSREIEKKLARDDVAYVQAGYVTLKRDLHARGKFQVSKTAYRYPNPKDELGCLEPSNQRPGGVFKQFISDQRPGGVFLHFHKEQPDFSRFFKEGCGGNKTMDTGQMGRCEELCKRLLKKKQTAGPKN